MQHFMITEDTLDLAKSPSLGLWLNKQNEKKKKKRIDESGSSFAAAGRMPEPARQKQLAAALAQLDSLAENFQRLLWHQNSGVGDAVLAKFAEIKQLVDGAIHSANHSAARAANIPAPPLHGFRDYD